MRPYLFIAWWVFCAIVGLASTAAFIAVCVAAAKYLYTH